jgi:hypothetical protein
MREVQSQIYYDQQDQIQGGKWTFIYQPFTTADLLNWKHHTTSFTEKPQSLIDLMQLDPSSKLTSPLGQTANSFF